MSTLTGEQALSELLSGNLRYLGQQFSGKKSAERRAQVAAGQQPFAAVIGCSDSRVPPEIIFDQGLGDLFVLRSAGHVIGGVGLGSIEYTVEHLHVPLIAVLGHSQCGAVAAALDGHAAKGSLTRVLEPLLPVAAQAKAQGGDALDRAVRANIQRVVAQLSAEAVFSKLVRAGMLKIAGLHYDLNTGVVTVVP
jgi:carbonic anhydrase